jgi:hypothetical protein
LIFSITLFSDSTSISNSAVVFPWLLTLTVSFLFFFSVYWLAIASISL